MFFNTNLVSAPLYTYNAMSTFLPSKKTKMKKLILLTISAITSVAMAQTPCASGSAGAYPCDGINLQSQVDLNTMNASSGNDSWGWTDPENGNEYALMGLDNGTAFVDITDPVNPIYLGKLPTATSNSIWRDVKVYNNHAFIVSEANGHGMQVFDLTNLRDVPSPPEIFSEDGFYAGFGSAHNIVINEDSGYAFGVGTDTYNGGAHFVNIQDPTNPTAAGGYSASGYSHDAQVVIYDGPDTEHNGKEIYIGSNADEVVIVDISDKNNPILLSAIDYGDVGYTHQGWLTEDHRYYLLGDEGDEFGSGFDTRTVVFDFSDLDNPDEDFEYFGPTAAVDHNGYVRQDKFFLSNYAAGLRVIDISDIANGNMTEVAYFDTYPNNNSASYDGAWNVYPFFPSGNIIISDQYEGLFVVHGENLLGTPEITQGDFGMYPNPAKNSLTITSTTDPIAIIELYNILGQRVLNFSFDQSLSEKINISGLNSGMYMVRINQNTVKKLVVK